jgi:hypothetical protein
MLKAGGNTFLAFLFETQCGAPEGSLSFVARFEAFFKGGFHFIGVRWNQTEVALLGGGLCLVKLLICLQVAALGLLTGHGVMALRRMAVLAKPAGHRIHVLQRAGAALY